MTRVQACIKRTFDITASAAGLAVLWPLMLVIALLVKLTSPGPILFRQQRVGRYGRLFTCVKFRTMTVGAEREGSVTTAADRRITAIGKWLRRLKLDELPQLWNVLVGQMSFVGPRPDVPGYADRLEGEARRVLDLRPSITGPATLAFRDEEELLARAADPRVYNDMVIWPRKVELNLEYLNTWSLWRDIRLILATLLPFSRPKTILGEPKATNDRSEGDSTGASRSRRG